MQREEGWFVCVLSGPTGPHSAWYRTITSVNCRSTIGNPMVSNTCVWERYMCMPPSPRQSREALTCHPGAQRLPPTSSRPSRFVCSFVFRLSLSSCCKRDGETTYPSGQQGRYGWVWRSMHTWHSDRVTPPISVCTYHRHTCQPLCQLSVCPSIHEPFQPSYIRLNTYNSGNPEAMDPCTVYQDLTTVPAPAPRSSDGSARGSTIFLLLACRSWQLHMASASTATMTRPRCEIWFSPADEFQLLLSRLSSSTDRRDPFWQHTRWVSVFFTIPSPGVLRYRSNMGKSGTKIT